jgi:cardiolipin synthase
MRKTTVLPIGLLLCVLTFTSCTTTEHLTEIEQSAAGSSLQEYLGSMGYEPIPTSEPGFFYDGGAWEDELLCRIEASEKHILVSTFLGNEHFSTDSVWQALKKKADAGVDVYIIIDASSQFQAVPHTREYVKSALYMLRQMGMHVVEYNAFSLSNGLFLPNLFDRDHRKFYVFDGKISAVGGININHTSLHYPAGRGHIDLMGVVESGELAQKLTDIFISTYNRYSPDSIRKDMFISTPVEKKSSHAAMLFEQYFQDNHAVRDMFDAFAVFTQEELWMVQGYTFLTPGLEKRIRYLTDKGVNVHVILSEHASHEKYQKAALYNALTLIEAGAEVHLFNAPDDSFLHMKLTVADGRYVSFGSANYNLRSHTTSRELNLMYDDALIAAESMEFIQLLMKNSTAVTKEQAGQWRSFSYWYYHMLMQVWG